MWWPEPAESCGHSSVTPSLHLSRLRRRDRRVSNVGETTLQYVLTSVYVVNLTFDEIFMPCLLRLERLPKIRRGLIGANSQDHERTLVEVRSGK